MLDLSDLSNLLIVRFVKFKSPRILSERGQPSLAQPTLSLYYVEEGKGLAHRASRSGLHPG